jgi:hypothetical protein
MPARNGRRVRVKLGNGTAILAILPEVRVLPLAKWMTIQP